MKVGVAVVSIVVLAAVAVVVLNEARHTSGAGASPTLHSPRYHVVLTATFPRHAAVGQSLQVSLAARNTGKPIPRFILIVDVSRLWQIGSVRDCNGPAHQLPRLFHFYDVGPVPANAVCQVRLSIHAQKPGSAYVNVFGSANVDATGIPDGAATINGGRELARWTTKVSG